MRTRFPPLLDSHAHPPNPFLPIYQAVKYLERVLEISKEIGDYVGDADAYGTIADIYTDMGEFEKAAEYYDRYISRMGTEGPV
jgi:tetratricopeptide (TPR) repeat protein